MARFQKGDKVVAVKDIGGIVRGSVPKGTPGVVLEAGWTVQTRVRFRREGGMFSSDSTIDIRVSDDEIA